MFQNDILLGIALNGQIYTENHGVVCGVGDQNLEKNYLGITLNAQIHTEKSYSNPSTLLGGGKVSINFLCGIE